VRHVRDEHQVREQIVSDDCEFVLQRANFGLLCADLLQKGVNVSGGDAVLRDGRERVGLFRLQPLAEARELRLLWRLLLGVDVPLQRRRPLLSLRELLLLRVDRLDEPPALLVERDGSIDGVFERLRGFRRVGAVPTVGFHGVGVIANECGVEHEWLSLCGDPRNERRWALPTLQDRNRHPRVHQIGFMPSNRRSIATCPQWIISCSGA
jgi:hypothetical protein